MDSPIIVVGRPRSGSTLFTRLLNESPDLCIVNDFYYLQYVDSLGGFSQCNPIFLKNIARQILLTLKDRQKLDDSGKAGIEFNQSLTPDKEEKLKTFIEQCLRQPNYTWSSLFSSIMEYNAHLFGKKIWGYNTPQDYLYLPRLQQAFPQAKFIFVMRDPREVMRSYKYMDYLKDYHDPARYHPILQAIAWKSAMNSFLKNQQKDNILLVKYEDILNDVNQVFANVSDFVKSRFPQINLQDFGNNSTFKNKQKKRLTTTEIWLCEQIAGKEIQAAGYYLHNCKPSLRDLNYILYVTKRALNFYLKNSLVSTDTRKRVLNLAKAQLIKDK